MRLPPNTTDALDSAHFGRERAANHQEPIRDFRSMQVIVQTASMVSRSRAELKGFRDLLAAGRRLIEGAKYCIAQSTEALLHVQDGHVPAQSTSTTNSTHRRPFLDSATPRTLSSMAGRQSRKARRIKRPLPTPQVDVGRVQARIEGDQGQPGVMSGQDGDILA